MAETAVKPNPHGTMGKIVAAILLTSAALGTAALLAILAAMTAEQFLRGGATLDDYESTQTEDVVAVQAIPRQTLTGTVTIRTRHADRKRLELLIHHAVTERGGYRLEQDEDRSMYAGPSGMAAALAAYAARDPERRPNPEAYGATLEQLRGAVGPPDTQFAVQVTAPAFENPFLVDLTLGSIMAGMAAVVLLMMTATAATVTQTVSKEERNQDGEAGEDHN